MRSKRNLFNGPFGILLFVLFHFPVRSLGRPGSQGPLFLSPLIEKGDYSQAQQEATVPPMLPGIESFAGYITVNATHESNMFFWMFKSLEGDWKTKPLIIWLQGGPGASSLFGLFTEIGPFYLAQGKLYPRAYPWCRKYNLMFIDNPVGAGFSFTRTDAGYPNSELDVAEDLYTFIVQFYTMFPELRYNPLFLNGQSYAGKYIPSFAHYIYQQNQKKKRKFSSSYMSIIPLAAVAIGNGLTDPLNSMLYGDYLYQLGMIDEKGRNELHFHEEIVRAMIRAGQYEQAEQIWYDLYKDIIDLTGVQSLYNYINDSKNPDEFVVFVNKEETRQALHAGNEEFNSMNRKTYAHLAQDAMQSVKPLIEDILNWEAFDFITYNGQLDIICAFPLTANVNRNLKWSHSKDFIQAKRCHYLMGDRVVGYFKTAGKLTEIMFRGCGHMVPTECPEVASNFLDMYIMNRRGFRCLEEGGSSKSATDLPPNNEFLIK